MNINTDDSKIHIISRSRLPFQNRQEAGELLAGYLTTFKGKNSVVLGIPRGGVVVARELARKLKADLDVVLSRKLGTPGQLELAMGSVSEDGRIFLNQNVVNMLNITEAEISQERAHQSEEMKRRYTLIRGVYPKVALKDRLVIVTDDGVATGATLQAALWAIRQEKPGKVIAALPVASEEAVNRLIPEVDELYCLKVPADFAAVGQFYYRFEPVSDKEVLEILTEEKARMEGI